MPHRSRLRCCSGTFKTQSAASRASPLRQRGSRAPTASSVCCVSQVRCAAGLGVGLVPEEARAVHRQEEGAAAVPAPGQEWRGRAGPLHSRPRDRSLAPALHSSAPRAGDLPVHKARDGRRADLAHRPGESLSAHLLSPAPSRTLPLPLPPALPATSRCSSRASPPTDEATRLAAACFCRLSAGGEADRHAPRHGRRPCLLLERPRRTLNPHGHRARTHTAHRSNASHNTRPSTTHIGSAVHKVRRVRDFSRVFYGAILSERAR